MKTYALTDIPETWHTDSRTVTLLDDKGQPTVTGRLLASYPLGGGTCDQCGHGNPRGVRLVLDVAGLRAEFDLPATTRVVAVEVGRTA